MHSLLFSSPFHHSQNKSWSSNEADIFENEEQFLIEVALPGFDKDSLTISASEHQVVLRAERELPIQEGYSHIQEGNVRSNRVERTFRFKQAVLAESIEAVMEHGVLSLRIPKKTTEHLVVVHTR